MNPIKNIIYKFNYFFGQLSSNEDALIINSYLPIIEELKLKLYLINLDNYSDTFLAKRTP